VAKTNELDVELVETNPGAGVSADYRKINKLGRIPTFVGADGFILSEVLAISVYCTSQFYPFSYNNMMRRIKSISVIPVRTYTVEALFTS